MKPSESFVLDCFRQFSQNLKSLRCVREVVFLMVEKSDQSIQQNMRANIIQSLLLLAVVSVAFKPCEPFGRRIFYGDVIKKPESPERLVVYFNTVDNCQRSYLQLVKKSGMLQVQCETTELTLSNNTNFYQTHVHKCSTGAVEFEETFHYNVFGWDGSSSNPMAYKDFVSVILANPLDKSRQMSWIVVADWGNIKVNSYKYTVIDSLILRVRAQEEMDAILIMGDIGYDLDTNNCDNYEKFIVELADTVADIPIVLVTGNHEYNTPDNWQLYAKSFSLYGLDSDKVAALSLGSIYMVAFDPYDLLYVTPDTDLVFDKFNQLLDQAQNRGQFVLTTSHYPLACSGSSKFCSKDRQFMKAYWQTMLDHKVSFYLGAHYHTYQRLYPYTKNDKFTTQSSDYSSDGDYLITIIEGVGGNDKDIVENIDKIQAFTASYTIGETGFGVMKADPSNINYRHFSTKTGEMDQMNLKIVGPKNSGHSLRTE